MKIITTVLLLLVSYFGYSQNVGINTTGGTPNASAILDVESVDKGLLIPRVDIANLATAAPVTTPATSLLVYNTNATTGIGYYYWDASKWVNLVDANTAIEDHDWYEVGTTTAPDNINDDIFTQGKVGIGTTSPGVDLDIYSQSSEVKQWLHSINGGNSVRTEFLHKTNGEFSIIADRGGNSSTEAIIFLSYPGVLKENMRIVQNGNVGIGTSIPQTKLHVNNGVFLVQNSSSNNGLISFDADGNNTVGITDYASISGLNGGLSLSGLSNAITQSQMFISNGGNVGVSTTSPLSKLHINQNGTGLVNSNELLLMSNSDQTSSRHGIEFRGSVNNTEARIRSGNFGNYKGGLIFETRNATSAGLTTDERMRITFNGNVGIGTPTPDTKLTIQQASGRMIKTISTSLVTTNSSNNFIGGYDINDDRFWYLGDGSSTKRIVLAAGSAVVTDYTLGFEVGGVNRLHIETNGNVGVGTVSPTEKLEINGSIKIVDGTQGAGKVLVSDANGKGSWVTNVALVPTVIGSVGNSFHDFMLSSSSNIPNWYLDLPVGKWVISIGGLLNRTFSTNTYYGARLTLSSSSTSVVSTGFTYIGSSLVLNIKSTNANATAPPFAGFVSGTILVNVTTAQRIYLWNQASDAYSVGSAGHGFAQNGENYFIASPIN